MDTQTFQFKLVSPEKVILERDITMAVIPGAEGNMGILPAHAPVISTLRPGVLSVHDGERTLMKVFVDGGVAEVTPKQTTVLVSKATPVEMLEKDDLELEIKNLLEDLNDYDSEEERRETSLNLEITRTKLMELLAHNNH